MVFKQGNAVGKFYLNLVSDKKDCLMFFSEEFVAHGANVNCLAMGHKTGRVMVTGGEDRKVNLWTAGKPNCIMVILSTL
jgi:hypothetical protein